MNPTPSTSGQPQRTAHARLATGAFMAGLVAAILAVRALPPAPIYSPQLGRATYLQSYETAYFASLRAYEQPIRDTLAGGYIPIVVFGDSSIRGTGAAGEDVWTRQLEKRLQTVNSRVRVLNYAQNAGDLVGPFLYHHLQQKFPEARYIVQWHFPSEVGVRHQFHYWLTSEIALCDGQQNPAIRASLKIVPVTKWEERATYVLAAFNVLTNYLDAGNWARYLRLGRPYQTSGRQVRIRALQYAADTEIPKTRFVPLENPQAAAQMAGYFQDHLAAREIYVQRPLEDRRAYFADMFPTAQRSHLLLLTLDFNPYYAPHDDPIKMASWRTVWTKLRADMAQIPDLRWVSLTGSAGELRQDDYLDLGHYTINGQRRLAEAVAQDLIAPGGWFDSATPGAELPPDPLKSQWYETKSLKPYQLVPFQHMSPRPVRFYSSFGPGLDTTFYNAHPKTRLIFQAPAGRRRLQTTVRLNLGAYDNLPEDQATDGIQLEIATITQDGQRTVVFTRVIDPYRVAADRGILPVDVSFDMLATAEVELFIGPGINDRDTRDWAQVGPLTIK